MSGYIEVSLSKEAILKAESKAELEINLIFLVATESCNLGRKGKEVTKVDTYQKSSHENVCRISWKWAGVMGMTEDEYKAHRKALNEK